MNLKAFNVVEKYVQVSEINMEKLFCFFFDSNTATSN